MDKILRGLSYVTIYLDDILVHSPDEEAHKAHLLEVFNRLSAAGVTLRGKKCRIGMKTVAMSFQLRECHLIPAKYKPYKSGQFPVILQMYDSSWA